MSKGSWHRPIDRTKFNESWERIFRKKGAEPKSDKVESDSLRRAEEHFRSLKTLRDGR